MSVRSGRHAYRHNRRTLPFEVGRDCGDAGSVFGIEDNAMGLDLGQLPERDGMIRSDECEQRRTDRLNAQGLGASNRLRQAGRAAPKHLSRQTPPFGDDLPQSLDRFGIPQADAWRRSLAMTWRGHWSGGLSGQPAATENIIPYIQMYQAGLAPEGRPIGVFLLLGPTGTGKTKTIEALAEILHGSPKNLLKIDCGEFQMEHEVAKLIGAPPGYLGHRETQPMLTQQRLNSVTSEKNSISLVLFDEIEKAAPSMTRLLLGVLDKGILRLGDNSTVNFEKSLIFLTSNSAQTR